MPEHDEPMEMTVRPRTEPTPMTAEALLLALIKSNKAERAVTQEAIDQHTAEASRLDAIREGLDAALRAVRYPASTVRDRDA